MHTLIFYLTAASLVGLIAYSILRYFQIRIKS